MEKPVVIFGAGELGRAVLEIFESNNVVTYCFLDDNKSLHKTEIDNVQVIGATDDENILSILGKKCEAFIAIDDNKFKRSMVAQLKEQAKVVPINAIHNTAYLSFSASIGHGNLINGRVVIGAGAVIGAHCILNSGSIVDYNAILGDYVQMGAGSIISSGVKVSEGTFIGPGAVLVPGITVGKNARIGAGSIVVEHVKNNETVFGNPAVKIE